MSKQVARELIKLAKEIKRTSANKYVYVSDILDEIGEMIDSMTSSEFDVKRDKEIDKWTKDEELKHYKAAMGALEDCWRELKKHSDYI